MEKKRSRRANNEGTTYWDEGIKRYVGQYSYTDPHDGKKKRKKITNVKQQEVSKAGKLFLKEIELQRERTGKMNITQLTEKWLEQIQPTVKIKTYERYGSVVRRYISPHLGEILINELTVGRLQDHFKFLRKKGGVNGELSMRSVNMTRTILITLCNYAIGIDQLDSNTAMKTKGLREERKEIRFFTKEDYEKLIKVAKEHSSMAYLVLRIAFETGCRIGEIFGLEYSGINWATKIISIKQTVVSTKKGKLLQKSAKNVTSIRKILVTTELMAELKVAYELHQERKEKYRNQFKKGNDFVIEKEDGDFCDPSYFSYKIFKKLLREAGLSKQYRMHDCRHTHATWLLEQGVNIKIISERLGHKSIRTTMDIYSHVTPSMQEEAVTALEKMMNKGEMKNDKTE